jgi:hypothetical protein
MRVIIRLMAGQSVVTWPAHGRIPLNETPTIIAPRRARLGVGCRRTLADGLGTDAEPCFGDQTAQPQMSRCTFKTTREPNGSMFIGSSFMWANFSRTAR